MLRYPPELDTRLPDHAGLPDRYELIEQISSGGQAHVYRALDLQSLQDVVIKIYKPPRELVNFPADRAGWWAAYTERLLQSFQTCERLFRSDPTLVVRPLDFVPDAIEDQHHGRHWRVPFGVFEYLPLMDVEQRLRERTHRELLPFGFALLECILNLARRQHDLHFCHGDLSFRNVLAYNDGRDWGLKVGDLDTGHWVQDAEFTQMAFAGGGLWHCNEHRAYREEVARQGRARQPELQKRIHWELRECAAVVRKELLLRAPGQDGPTDGRPGTGSACLGGALFDVLERVQEGREYQDARGALELVAQARRHASEPTEPDVRPLIGPNTTRPPHPRPDPDRTLLPDIPTTGEVPPPPADVVRPSRTFGGDDPQRGWHAGSTGPAADVPENLRTQPTADPPKPVRPESATSTAGRKGVSCASLAILLLGAGVIGLGWLYTDMKANAVAQKAWNFCDGKDELPKTCLALTRDDASSTSTRVIFRSQWDELQRAQTWSIGNARLDAAHLRMARQACVFSAQDLVLEEGAEVCSGARDALVGALEVDNPDWQAVVGLEGAYLLEGLCVDDEHAMDLCDRDLWDRALQLWEASDPQELSLIRLRRAQARNALYAHKDRDEARRLFRESGQLIADGDDADPEVRSIRGRNFSSLGALLWTWGSNRPRDTWTKTEAKTAGAKAWKGCAAAEMNEFNYAWDDFLGPMINGIQGGREVYSLTGEVGVPPPAGPRIRKLINDTTAAEAAQKARLPVPDIRCDPESYYPDR